MKKLGIIFALLISSFSYSQVEDAKPVFENSSQFQDYAPTLSYDGNTLIFQSNRDGSYKLFKSSKQKNNWSKPQPIVELNQFFESHSLVGGPSLSKDGKTLFFSAFSKQGEGNMDIYHSIVSSNGLWNEPESLPQTINTVDFEGFPSISPDGQTLFFVRRYLTKKKIDPKCSHIYFSKFNNGKWLDAQELIFEDPYICPGSPTMLSNNSSLVFSHQNGDNLDLFILQTNKDSTGNEIVPWSFANSKMDDHYITMDGSGEEIIYNSGQKLYQLEVPLGYRLDPYLEISGPVLDIELKSPIDAVYELKSTDGTVNKFGALSGKKKDDDIKLLLKGGKKYDLTISHPLFQDTTYSYDLTSFKEFKKETTKYYLEPKRKEVVLNITDADSEEKINVKISIGNLNLDEEISLDQIVKRDGKYVVSLREGNNYNIEISSQEGYAYSNTNYSVPVSKSEVTDRLVAQSKASSQTSSDDPMFLRLDSLLASTTRTSDTNPEALHSTQLEDVKIKVLPLKVGANLELKDIYFDFNSSKLKEESSIELLKVVQLMKENPNLIIEIGAHTDNVGSSKFNHELSLKRAKSIVDFLIKQSVDGKRLKSKGYGFSKPIADNSTEEGRAKNRRVELTVKK